MRVFFVFFYSIFLVSSVNGGEATIAFKLTKEFCRKTLVDHKPKGNVMYQAGVDSEGNAVVSADLNGFKVPLPTKIRIPVSIKKQYTLQTQSSGTTSSTGTSTATSQSTINSLSQGIDQTLLDAFLTEHSLTKDSVVGNLTTTQLAEYAALSTQSGTGTGAVATTNESTIGSSSSSSNVDQTALNTFLTKHSLTSDSTLGNLTIEQRNEYASLATQSGTSTGTSTGTTSSSGTVNQSGTGTFVSKGTIKSPYVDEIPLGFVEYELKSGKMSYNGKSFSSKEKAILRRECQKILEK